MCRPDVTALSHGTTAAAAAAACCSVVTRHTVSAVVMSDRRDFTVGRMHALVVCKLAKSLVVLLVTSSLLSSALSHSEDDVSRLSVSDSRNIAADI